MQGRSRHPALRTAEPNEGAIVIRAPKRTITVYRVTEQELDQLAAASAPVSWTLFGTTLGAAIAFLIAIFSALPDLTWYAIFHALLWASLLLAVFFLFNAIRDSRKSAREVRRIKHEREVDQTVEYR